MSAVITTASEAAPVWLRPNGRRCEVVVDGKDAAIGLRCRLVSHGYSCTYPQPTWHRGEQAFHVSLGDGRTVDDLTGLVAGTEGVQLVSTPVPA